MFLEGIIMGKKHYWWRYLLFTLLGIFIGLGGVVGGIAAAGFIIKGSDIDNWANQDIFTDEYESKSIVEIIKTIATNENDDIDTLGGLSRISPMVDMLVDEINKMFEEQIGYSWPKEELYKIKFEELGDWMVQNLKDNATIAAMIGADRYSDAVLKLFLFPKDENGEYNYEDPYTITDFMTEGFFDDIINQMKFRDVLGDIDPNDELLNAIADWGLEDFKDESKLDSLTISQVMGDISSENTLLYSIKDWSMKDLKDKDKLYNTLTVEDLIGEVDPDNTFLYAIRDWTISKLISDDGINSLTIEELFGEVNPSNSILYALKDLTISEFKDKDKLSAKINGLTIEQAIGEIPAGNTFLESVKDWLISDLKNQDKINSLTIRQVLGDDGLGASKILSSIADIQIGNLKTEIETLPLNKFIDTEGNKILSLVADSPINQLASAVNNLSFKDIIDKDSLDGNESLYNYLSNYNISQIDTAFKEMTIGALITDDSGLFKYLDKDEKISDLGKAVKKLKIVDAFEDDIFTKDPLSDDRDDWTMKSVWKFLLTPGSVHLSGKDVKYGEDPNKEYYESYTIGEGMADVVTNFEEHTKNENLSTLKDAGLLVVDDAFLNKTIPAAGVVALENAGVELNGRTKYGELTVRELTIVLAAIG